MDASDVGPCAELAFAIGPRCWPRIKNHYGKSMARRTEECRRRRVGKTALMDLSAYFDVHRAQRPK